MRSRFHQFITRTSHSFYGSKLHELKAATSTCSLLSNSTMKSLQFSTNNTVTQLRPSIFQQQQIKDPRMYSNDVTSILAGVAIVGTLIGIGKMAWDASSSPKTYTLRTLSKEELKVFLMSLLSTMEYTIARVPELEKDLQKYFEEQKLQPSEMEFATALKDVFLQALSSIEGQIRSDLKLDDASIEQAMIKYQSDPEIVELQKKLSIRIQEVMNSILPPIEIPEHLTSEKTLEILSSLVNAMDTSMRDMLDYAKQEGVTKPDKAMEEFSHLYMEQAQELTIKTYRDAEITDEIFQAALQKYATQDPLFQQAVQKIYEKQLNDFKKLGLTVNPLE